MNTILHTESSMGWGGQEIRIIQESLGMIRRGHRVIIAAPEQSTIFRKGKEADIEVFPAYFQKKNPVSVLKMLSLITREKVDIVNTHSSSDSWISTIAAKLSRVKPKIIRTRHISTPISRSILSRLIYDILPDVVITTGKEIRQRMIHNNGFNGSKIFSIPTGIDLKRFNPAKVKPAQLKNPPTPPHPPLTKGGQEGGKGGRGGLIDNFSVGMVGVLRSWKGHRYFIDAVPSILEEIPDALFYIIGDGPQFQNIKDMIKDSSLKNKVFMLGHREDIPEILASLDVIVHPSYANEGVPQSILQALAMKKPVVASDAGAIREIVIDRETGFLIEPKNPLMIADRVIQLYKHPELRAEFGDKGRQVVQQNYSFEDMLNKIENLYEKLLKNKKAMKILLSFPGHLKTVPMNNYICQTLKSMGHEVKLFNCGTHGIYPRLLKGISKEAFLNHIDRKLLDLANRFKPDLFLTVFGFDHRKSVIEQIKSMGIITACWWLNDPFQFKRSVAQAAFYDYYFTNSKGSLNDYHREGVKNVFYLPVACYPPVHRKLTDVSIKKYDITFAGDYCQKREEVLSALLPDFNVSVFGPWKKKKIQNSPILTEHIVKNRFFSPEEMVKIFNQSKIVLNIHSWFEKWSFGINPRVFEANGCGAFQVSDYKEEIPELYEPEKEIVLYGNIEELKEKLRYFLNHEKERLEIAENGFLKTVNHHTYEYRLKEMFYIAGLK